MGMGEEKGQGETRAPSRGARLAAITADIRDQKKSETIPSLYSRVFFSKKKMNGSIIPT